VTVGAGFKPRPYPQGRAALWLMQKASFVCKKPSNRAPGFALLPAHSPNSRGHWIAGDSGRVRVLLEIMGGTIPVQLERKFVTAA
jgi:hypothetical protein